MYNLTDMGGPIRNTNVSAGIACKITNTQKPHTTTRVQTTGESELAGKRTTEVNNIILRANM